MYLCFMCTYSCVLYMCVVPVKERRVLNAIELELWVIVKHDVGAGNPRSSGRIASALNNGATFVVPSLNHYLFQRVYMHVCACMHV